MEKHHTDAFEYKELVQQEISLIETLLAKLKQAEGLTSLHVDSDSGDSESHTAPPPGSSQVNKR